MHVIALEQSIMSLQDEALKAWQARYGEPANLPAADTVIAQMLQHRSVRAYSDLPVDEQMLSWAIAAAQSASTSSNLQAWSVLAVRDRERLASLPDCPVTSAMSSRHRCSWSGSWTGHAYAD